MNMLEQMARAICRERMQRQNEIYREFEPSRYKTQEVLDRMIEDSWEFEIDVAKAALACLRSPTKRMIDAKLPTSSIHSQRYESRKDLRPLIFRTMIDAALEGK